MRQLFRFTKPSQSPKYSIRVKMVSQALKIQEKAEEVTRDGTTAEEIASTTIPPSPPHSQQTAQPSRNACRVLNPKIQLFLAANTFLVTELLSPKKNPPYRTPTSSYRPPPSQLTTFTGRSGLGAYTQSPESFPASRVISYSDKFVTINDLYPKSSIHLLLLPRDTTKHLLHPFDALSDPVFLAEVKAEVVTLRELAAKELKRRFGKFSVKEKVREDAMEKALEEEGEIDEENLPLGRDWISDVIVGVHTHPSMVHLHIHILSRDRHSDCLRHRKHYNSFATPFLVSLDEFPLSKEEMRRRRKEKWLERDLVCWRCGKNFGNKFAKLKAHLEGEFEEWRKV